MPLQICSIQIAMQRSQWYLPLDISLFANLNSFLVLTGLSYESYFSISPLFLNIILTFEFSHENLILNDLWVFFFIYIFLVSKSNWLTRNYYDKTIKTTISFCICLYFITTKQNQTTKKKMQNSTTFFKRAHPQFTTTNHK